MDIPLVVATLGFKDVIWDMGYIWIILLLLGVAFIFEEIRWIVEKSKGPKVVKKQKPRYEIIFRQRIE